MSTEELVDQDTLNMLLNIVDDEVAQSTAVVVAEPKKKERKRKASADEVGASANKRQLPYPTQEDCYWMIAAFDGKITPELLQKATDGSTTHFEALGLANDLISKLWPPSYLRITKDKESINKMAACPRCTCSAALILATCFDHPEMISKHTLLNGIGGNLAAINREEFIRLSKNKTEPADIRLCYMCLHFQYKQPEM